MRGIIYESGFEKYRKKTFAHAAKEWFEDPAWRGKSRERQGYSWEALWPYIGNTPLSEVNDLAMRQFREDRLAGKRTRAVKSGTVDKDLTFVSTILNYSERILGWIPSRRLIRKINGPTMQPQVLSWDEQDRLFDKLPDYMKAPCLFAVNTGARMGEITTLKWSQLQNFSELGVFVFVVLGKNRKERPIILNSIARRIVDHQRMNGSEYVFAKDGRRIRDWCRPFKEAWRGARLTMDPYLKSGAHNLRHTFTTRLAALQTPEWIISRLLGHANANITQNYGKHEIESLLEYAERLTGNFSYTTLKSIRMVG